MECEHPHKMGYHVVSTYFDIELSMSQPRYGEPGWSFTANAWIHMYA